MTPEPTLISIIKTYLRKVSERPGGRLMQDKLGLFAHAKIEEKTYLFAYYKPSKNNGFVYVTVENEMGLPTAGFILNFTRVKTAKNKYVPVASIDIGENNCSEKELESLIKNLNASKELFFTVQ